MKVNKIHDEIYEIEEFISQLEVNSILDKIDDNWNKSDNVWDNRIKILEPTPKEFLDIRERISNLFLSYAKVNYIINIHRFEVGGSMGVHTDKMPSNNVEYGIVCYLNNNYTGGEIYYPDLDIKLKPKARSIVLHPGNVNHGVSEVTSGDTRYFLTTFVQSDEFTQVVLKDLE